MKGVIFNYLEEFAVKNFGEEGWESVISQAEVSTEDAIYVGPGNYPDSDLVEIVSTASRLTETPIDSLLFGFGEFVLDKFHQDFPVFFERVDNARDFLSSIHCVIHVEVKKLYPDADTPTFEYEDPNIHALTMKYYSERKLCVFLRGLISGVQQHFKEKIDYVETQCMHDGAEFCNFDLAFSKGE